MSTSSVRGYLLAILTALLWSAIYPLSRFCMEQEMPPLELAFWRALLAGLLFLLYAFWNRRLRVPLRLALQLMLFGAVGIAGYFALVFFTIQGCGVAMSSILMYTAPPLVAVFSWFIWKERLRPVMGAALAMSLLGIIFVSLSGGGLPEGASLLGLICGIASGIAFALQFIVVKYFLQFCTTEQIYGYAFLTAAVVFFPCIAFSEKTIEVWGALAGIGIVASFGGFLLYGLALSILRSTQVAAIVNIDPVFSTAWAFLFFGELLPPLGILGALLVLGGVSLTVLGSEQERAENPATVQATTL